MGTALAADAGPRIRFPAAARERIAIASYPFREFIAGREDKPGGGKMELKKFAAHVSAKLNTKKIEPWSAHFPSLNKAYLEGLRAVVAQAGGAIVNIAVDGEHSPYAADSAERERAVTFSKQWIDTAAAIGSPQRADKHSTSEGFETGCGTDGGEFEARGGVWRGEKRGGKPGERQCRQRRPIFPGDSRRKSEKRMAARAAGLREHAGGL
jgi:hypothetical protein